MWQEFAIAMCLVLVIEGLLPFLAPQAWRSMVQNAAGMSDRGLRIAGLASMMLGTALLYIVN